MDHLYQTCPTQRRTRETASTATVTVWAEITVKGIGISRQSSDNTEETTWYRQQPEVAERSEEEHRDPHPIGVSSGLQEEQVQQDTARQAAMGSSETQATRATSALVHEPEEVHRM